MQDKIIKATAELQPITIQAMCQAAPDLFRISAQFLLVEPYLPSVTA